MKMEEQTVAIDQVTKKFAKEMVQKIHEIRQLKDKKLIERRKKLLEVEKKYNQQIALMDRDIYKLENAIKLMVGSQAVYDYKKEYRQLQKQNKEKAKDLNTTDTTNENNDKKDNKQLNEEDQHVEEQGEQNQEGES